MQVVGTSSLNVRTGPGTNYPSIGKLLQGSFIRSLGCQNYGGTRWCQVQTVGGPGINGWASETYLQRVSGNPGPFPPGNPGPFPPGNPGPFPPGGGGGGVSFDQMPDYCRAQAAGYFQQPLQSIVVLPVEMNGGFFEVPGRYPPQGFNPINFTCVFGSDGRFVRIQ